MESSRRRFLAQAAAAPIVFGLPLAGCGPGPRPAWFPDALAKIRSEGRLGLAVRIPADPKRRCWLGHNLTWILNGEELEVCEVLADVVVLCLEEPAFAGVAGSARAKDELLLIDSEGYPIESLPALPRDPKEFAAALRTLIDGKDGARGRERAEEARRRASPDALRRLENLPKGADAATVAVGLGPLLPWVAAERKAAGPDSDRADRLLRAVKVHYHSLPPTEPGPRLPYGIELAPGMRGGCGDCGCAERPPSTALAIVGCGMGRVPPNARSFVRFVKA